MTFESIDMDSAFFASRYDKGTPDYINCPMSEEEYEAFWQALTTAEEAEVHGFEDKHVFEGCMPVEVMARRGTIRLLRPAQAARPARPEDGQEPYAVVQRGATMRRAAFIIWSDSRRICAFLSRSACFR